jgi:hypothetical protein
MMTTMPTITLPKPELVISGFADLPEAIQAAIEQLSKPFPISDVKVRPGAVKRDGSAALCLAYSDWWTGYLPRLNDEVGPNNWSIILRPWGEHQIIARLRAFGGLIEKESSGSAKGEANGAQEAEVQAKKRACAEGLMLGLYYYFLPTVWGKGERVGKDFAFADGEEQRCVYEMYARAGLVTRSTPSIAIPRGEAKTAHDDSSRSAATPAPRPAPAAASAPVGARAALARRSLEQAERRVGMRQPSSAAPADSTRASDAQHGLIARLVNELLRSGDETSTMEVAATLNALGARFGIHGLADLRSKAQLRSAATHLTKLQATRLIDALKALDGTLDAQAA